MQKVKPKNEFRVDYADTAINLWRVGCKVKPKIHNFVGFKLATGPQNSRQWGAELKALVPWLGWCIPMNGETPKIERTGTGYFWARFVAEMTIFKAPSVGKMMILKVRYLGFVCGRGQDFQRSLASSFHVSVLTALLHFTNLFINLRFFRNAQIFRFRQTLQRYHGNSDKNIYKRKTFKLDQFGRSANSFDQCLVVKIFKHI
jgi:hypothetical protein